MAMLGAVMCASDLGLYKAARDDMRTYHQEWIELARRQTRRLLNLDSASKLLNGRYSKQLPAAELVSILDFVHADSRGIGWIDELRAGYGLAAAFTSGIRTIEDAQIRYARKLRARQDVLSSYAEHFEFLSAKQISVSKFAAAVESAAVGTTLAVVVGSGARQSS